MARFLKTKKENIGLSPDQPFFRGEQKREQTKIRLIHYSADHLTEGKLNDLAEYSPESGVNWINIDGVHDTGMITALGERFDLEPLMVADLLDPHTRPKIHQYDDTIYISLKILQFDEQNSYISSENLVMMVKDGMLLSFQERGGTLFEPIRNRLRKNRRRLRQSGSDYLAFALLDVVIDHYIYIISQIGERIESIDEIIMDDPSDQILEQIKRYKREISYLRKVIKPCRELLINFEKIDSELIHPYMMPHIKELQSNIELANESVDHYRDILSDQLTIFHTIMSSNLNDILKFLTIFSVIFIPLTFIAGIYGTNFKFIPELGWQYGYFMMWGMIVVVAISMIIYFKRKRWF